MDHEWLVRLPGHHLSPPVRAMRYCFPPHRRAVLTEHCGEGSAVGGPPPSGSSRRSQVPLCQARGQASRLPRAAEFGSREQARGTISETLGRLLVPAIRAYAVKLLRMPKTDRDGRDESHPTAGLIYRLLPGRSPARAAPSGETDAMDPARRSCRRGKSACPAHLRPLPSVWTHWPLGMIRKSGSSRSASSGPAGE
jgi:hypothetical protein